MSTVGVIVVGHGKTASHMLAAARGILPTDALDDVVALDAGEGDSAAFSAAMCTALDKVDDGGGVLMLIDLLGASPCNCGLREGKTHDIVTLSGLNLAMLLKLSSLDRGAMAAEAVAEACADSGQRAVAVSGPPQRPTQSSKES
jgi:PTS system mannose-specific IIA component